MCSTKEHFEDAMTEEEQQMEISREWEIHYLDGFN